MSWRREIFVCLCGLCPKVDPVQWSGISVVNLMSRDGGELREQKLGSFWTWEKLVTMVEVLFLSFFVIYLIWWWRERGGKAVGEGTAFADWIHNATLSSSSPNSPELLNLSSSKYWKHADAVVSAPSFTEGTRCCTEEPGSSGTNCAAVLSFANPVQSSEFSLTFW